MDSKVREFIVQSAMIVNEKELEKVKAVTFEHIESLFAVKGAEYSKEVNRLENFLKGARSRGKTPEGMLLDMMYKHWLSIEKFIEELLEGIRHDPVQWFEKTDDIITYMILLKAIVKKRYEIEQFIDKKSEEQYGEGPAEKAFKEEDTDDVLKPRHTEPRIGTVYKKDE
jgi:hypothetical protein